MDSNLGIGDRQPQSVCNLYVRHLLGGSHQQGRAIVGWKLAHGPKHDMQVRTNFRRLLGCDRIIDKVVR